MEKTTYAELIAALEENVPEYGNAEVVFTYSDGSQRTARVARSLHGRGFIVMNKGSRKYGSYLSEHSLYDVLSFRVKIKKEKSPEEVWRKSWEQVVSRLAASGLWEELLGRVRLALGVGYEQITQAYNAYWADYSGTWEEKEAARTAAVGAINQHLLSTREDGTNYPNTEIIWYMYRPAKIKKMFFGADNEYKLEIIQRALAAKEESRVMGRTSYDVSYHYKPESKMAWYSEEYKGCGNGHYYLALDATHALFYEDD